MEFDREKFKRLIHYVIWKTTGRDGFGATKLYKVLWFAEARAFLQRRVPITGEAYIREKHGPVPKHGMQIRNELESENLISQRKVLRGSFPEWIFSSKVRPDVGFLSQEERAYVDYWIEEIDKKHTASTISDLSHDYAWETARMGEVIPIYAILANRMREPSDVELDAAKARAKELGII